MPGKKVAGVRLVLNACLIQLALLQQGAHRMKHAFTTAAYGRYGALARRTVTGAPERLR